MARLIGKEWSRHPKESVAGVSSAGMPALGETGLPLMGDHKPRQGDGVGRAQRQAQVVNNADRLLQQHRRHNEAGAVCLCHPPWLQEYAGWKKLCFFVRSKVLVDHQQHWWSEIQPYSRNGFGYFSYTIASSSTPSMSLVVTVQPPVPVGDEVQSLPVFAQLEASDPCTTSKGRAGQDHSSAFVPKMETSALSSSQENLLIETLPEI